MEYDIFGNEVHCVNKLRDSYMENPFTILDAKSGRWRARKKWWLNLGIKSEIGRNAKATDLKDWLDDKDYLTQNKNTLPSGTSVFDPVLCELMYTWFCPIGGKILDPFAGGSVRGVVANYLGYNYTGIDIRKEQIDSNIEQCLNILPESQQPNYIIGDSAISLDNIYDDFDMIFSCPPYHDLEVYSDMQGDISNMSYGDFLFNYEKIISKSCSKLKKGCFAIFVVSDIRVRKNFYRGFVYDTYNAFIKAGCRLYNDAILATPVGTAGLVASTYMKNKKLVKVHQNILIFKKL